MLITATDLGRKHRVALDVVLHRQEIVEITRYGQVVARLVPASAAVTLDESVVPQPVPPPADSVVETTAETGENLGKSVGTPPPPAPSRRAYLVEARHNSYEAKDLQKHRQGEGRHAPAPERAS